MMKRQLLAALVLSRALLLLAQHDDGDNDIMIVLPEHLHPPKPPTEEQKRMYEGIRRLDRGLPYKGGFNIYSTLGVLCRYSDNIVVGRLTDAWTEDRDGKRIERNKGGWFQKFELSVKTNVSGMVSESFIKLNFKWEGLGARSLKSGESAIVFMSRRPIASLFHEVAYYETGVRKRPPEPPPLAPPKGLAAAWAWVRGAPKKPPEGLFLLGQDRGVITFGGEEELSEYLAALDGYLRHLPHRKENPEPYYVFLRSLLKSPNPRIKEDARSDIIELTRSCPAFDVEQVLNDDAIDDGIKNYLRYLLYNEMPAE